MRQYRQFEAGSVGAACRDPRWRELILRTAEVGRGKPLLHGLIEHHGACGGGEAPFAVTFHCGLLAEPISDMTFLHLASDGVSSNLQHSLPEKGTKGF